MISLPFEYGLDQPRDVIRVVGSVGIDEEGYFPFDVGYDCLDGIPFSLFVVKYHFGAKRSGYRGGIVRGIPVYYYDIVGILLAILNNISYGPLFV